MPTVYNLHFSFFPHETAQSFQLWKPFLFFFISFLISPAYFCPPHPLPLAPSFSWLSPTLPPFHVRLSKASSVKVSSHFVRRICIAVPGEKAVAGREKCLERRCIKAARVRKGDLSFIKITDTWEGGVTGKHPRTHHTVCYTVFFFSSKYIYFLDFDQKRDQNARLNVQKSNTNTAICTSKCCHREITERVIYPRLHPCL